LVLATSWLNSVSAVAQEMLTLQNAKRSLHCAPPFTWSNTLAAAAQQWANACTRDPNNSAVFAHSPASSRPNQGENLAWGTGSFATASSSVERWYDEGSQYNYSAPGFSGATGHFTQMVWKGSTQLGCAMANCSGETLWVCRYSPAGNITNPGQFQQNVLPATCVSGSGTGQPPLPPPSTSSGIWSAFATNSRDRWGYAAHRADKNSASAQALNACGGAQVGCRVFWTTTDRCVSYAESRSGGYWYAAAGAATDAEAREAAINSCRSAKAPANTCKDLGVWCR
jgi:hypothetical protein